MRAGLLAAAAAMALASLATVRAQDAGARAGAAPAPALVDARADEVLRRMAAFLAGTKRFSLEAEESFDLEVGRAYRVQLTNLRTLTVERPSRFVADATGDTLHRSSWFDGRTLTVLNKQKNVYGSVEAPGTIDAVLDKVAEEFQVVIPLSDLLYSEPYATLMEGVLYGKYLGIHQAAGVPCHHLTFGQPGVYWQIWIDAGTEPWPRKLSAAYWEDSGIPRYEAVFRRWTPNPPSVEGQFRFKAPAGARQIALAELARTGAADLAPAAAK
jgi:hypothetical protein